MSAVAFRLFTRNGVDMHGSANLQVSDRLSVEIATRPGIATIAVMDRFAGRIVCLRRWAIADATAVLEAVRYAQRVAVEAVTS